MEQEQQKFNWEKPQRQPLAGLVIVFIKTIWEVLKRVWPFVLLMLFRSKAGRFDTLELMASLFAGLTVISSLINFYFFRFYILNDELIVKKGWLKKELVIVPLLKIQTVNIEESFLYNLLGIVKLSVDTAGSSNTEITIDALSRPMAKALQAQLDAKENITIGNDAVHTPFSIPILSLSGKDLLKLSLSANHVEAFFILLSFGFGIYDSKSDRLCTTKFLTDWKHFDWRNTYYHCAHFNHTHLFKILWVECGPYAIRLLYKSRFNQCKRKIGGFSKDPVYFVAC
jgi:putative membrane protein